MKYPIGDMYHFVMGRFHLVMVSVLSGLLSQFYLNPQDLSIRESWLIHIKKDNP